jgi:hypothetical protein
MSLSRENRDGGEVLGSLAGMLTWKVFIHRCGYMPTTMCPLFSGGRLEQNLGSLFVYACVCVCVCVCVYSMFVCVFVYVCFELHKSHP